MEQETIIRLNVGGGFLDDFSVGLLGGLTQNAHRVYWVSTLVS